MVVHKVPLKHINDDQQIQQIVTQQQPSSFHRSPKPVPFVRQAPVFDLEVITNDNYVPWVMYFIHSVIEIFYIIKIQNFSS